MTNMVFKKKKVTMTVSSMFFDDIFEPSRKRIEKQLGTKVTQVDFTDMLAKKKVNLNVKLNSNFRLNGKKKTKKIR